MRIKQELDQEIFSLVMSAVREGMEYAYDACDFVYGQVCCRPINCVSTEHWDAVLFPKLMKDFVSYGLKGDE